jgi:hypothetical protein
MVEQFYNNIFLPTFKTFSFPFIYQLEKLRQILSLTQEDVEYEITSAAMPLFRATALDAMNDAIQGTITAQDAWNCMNQRREDLLIPANKSHELVSTVVMNALGRPLEDVKKFLDVNNEQAVYTSMLQVLKAKDIVMEILNLAGWEEDFYDSFCNPIRRQSLTQIWEENTQRYKVYDIFIQQSIRKNMLADDDDNNKNSEGKLTNEDNVQISNVKRILAIDDVAAENQAAKNFGPKLYAVMERAMKEIIDDYTPELASILQQEIQQVLDDYKINDRIMAQNGRNLYQQALTLVQSQVRYIRNIVLTYLARFVKVTLSTWHVSHSHCHPDILSRLLEFPQRNKLWLFGVCSNCSV